MDYGQMRNQAKDNAKLDFYQNHGYQLERMNKKTFILRVDSDGTINFNKPLQEPLIIDRLSDIYLESFLTFHRNISSTAPTETDFHSSIGDVNKTAFVLKINEFNNQGNSNEGNFFNKIVIPHTIPNDALDGASYRKIHKSRKLNYICSMNPTTLSSLSGTITDLNNAPIFAGDGPGGGLDDMFLAEFVIVARD